MFCDGVTALSAAGNSELQFHICGSGSGPLSHLGNGISRPHIWTLCVVWDNQSLFACSLTIQTRGHSINISHARAYFFVGLVPHMSGSYIRGMHGRFRHSRHMIKTIISRSVFKATVLLFWEQNLAGSKVGDVRVRST